MNSLKLTKLMLEKRNVNTVLDKFYKIRHDFYISSEVEYDSFEYFTSIEKELKTLEILKLVLGLNATNRAIIRQAYEAGWITEEQFNLLKETLTKNKEGKNETL